MELAEQIGRMNQIQYQLQREPPQPSRRLVSQLRSSRLCQADCLKRWQGVFRQNMHSDIDIPDNAQRLLKSDLTEVLGNHRQCLQIWT